MQIELGMTVKDTITGLVGVVMGRTQYLTGCAHVGICPNKLKTDGSLMDWQWLDERRCSVIKKKIITYEEVTEKIENGGPEQDAPMM